MKNIQCVAIFVFITCCSNYVYACSLFNSDTIPSSIITSDFKNWIMNNLASQTYIQTGHLPAVQTAGKNGCVPNNDILIVGGRFKSHSVTVLNNVVIIEFKNIYHHPDEKLAFELSPGYFITDQATLDGYNFYFGNSNDKSEFEIGICDSSLLSIKTTDGNTFRFITSAGLINSHGQLIPDINKPNSADCQATKIIPLHESKKH